MKTRAQKQFSRRKTKLEHKIRSNEKLIEHSNQREASSLESANKRLEQRISRMKEPKQIIRPPKEVTEWLPRPPQDIAILSSAPYALPVFRKLMKARRAKQVLWRQGITVRSLEHGVYTITMSDGLFIDEPLTKKGLEDFIGPWLGKKVMIKIFLALRNANTVMLMGNVKTHDLRKGNLPQAYLLQIEKDRKMMKNKEELLMFLRKHITKGAFVQVVTPKGGAARGDAVRVKRVQGSKVWVSTPMGKTVQLDILDLFVPKSGGYVVSGLRSLTTMCYKLEK